MKLKNMFQEHWCDFILDVQKLYYEYSEIFWFWKIILRIKMLKKINKIMNNLDSFVTHNIKVIVVSIFFVIVFSSILCIVQKYNKNHIYNS